MKTRYFMLGGVISAALLAIILVFAFVTSAAAPVSSSHPSQRGAIEVTPADPSLLPGDFLVALPMVLPDLADIPPNLPSEQAAAYAYSLSTRRAQPILAVLRQLQAEGQITDFEVRPDLHGVVIHGGRPEAFVRLRRLQGAAAVLPFENDIPPACAVAAAGAFQEQIAGLSMAAGESRRAQAAVTGRATDPSIEVQSDPTGIFSYITGYTTPNTPVSMRLLHNGQVVASETATSTASSGQYSFYPEWNSCPNNSYSWLPKAGDTVEVTANGRTVSTLVAPLSAWLDPTTNTVAGYTEAGRSVDVNLFVFGSNSCGITTTHQTVSTDNNGNFSADFTGQANFNRRDYASVYALDANGNATYYYFYPYRIGANFNRASFSGYLKPSVPYTVTLTRGGSPLSSSSGSTDARGAYNGSFTTTVKGGDVLKVSGGGTNIQYTATDLNLSLDPATDQATGTTGANRTVAGVFYSQGGGYLQTSCSYFSGCASTMADGSGNFTLNAGNDIKRGDYAYFTVYDSEGNYQRTDGSLPVPAIVTSQDGSLHGYWGDPDAGYVTVTVKAKGGTVKTTRNNVWVSTWDGGYNTYVGSSTITSTDKVQVSDGAVTETMTVQNLSSRLYGSNGHLMGSAGGGHLVTVLYDYQRDIEDYYYRSPQFCTETDFAGGTYDLTFPGSDVGGQDAAVSWLSGPDGHYTTRDAYAFTVNVQQGGHSIWGYSELPYQNVTMTVNRNGSPLSVYTTTSGSSGYYYGWTSQAVTVTTDDILQVVTGEGNGISLTVPTLTVHTDLANKSLYGQSPPGEPVWTFLRRYGNSYSMSLYKHTGADDSGNYSASYDGLRWFFECSLLDLGHRCVQPGVWYTTSDGHGFWVDGPEPSSIGADGYENDNTSGTATAYTGVQTHTFHTVTDTDWVTFTVPVEDISNSVSYRIKTFNLGWGMGTSVNLYNASLSLQANWTGYQSSGDHGVLALWTPAVAGTYYLEITPPSSFYTVYCDAGYDLMILPIRNQIFLPVVMHGP